MNSPGCALPDMVIAGAPKAGTSSVHDWLAAHPDVLGSTPKETYYFVDPGTHMFDPMCNIANGLSDYARFFSPRREQKPRVIFESTPAYLYYDTARHGLHALPTKPRILFILREPAAQIYSGYTYFRDNWDWVPSDMSFADYIAAGRDRTHEFRGNELAVHALDYADYRSHLAKWRDTFGAERIKIMLFEDLTRDHLGFMKEIARWLGIDPGFYDSYDFPRANETYAVRSPAIQKINIALRRFLVPLGGLYKGLRAIYRRINTRKPTGPSAEDRAVLAQLRQDFAPANARLAQEFGLDLSSWAAAGGKG